MAESEYSRREFLATGIAASALIPARTLLGSGILSSMKDATIKRTPGTSTVLNVDYRQLVSHADLDYSAPVTRSEAGQPVGNGRT